MLGELHDVHGRYQLRFRRTLRHPPEKVWRALTEPEHLRAWFPADIEGERAEGASLRFVFRNEEGDPGDGEVLVCDPPSVLELSWGDELLRFELEPGDGGTGTVLTFVNTFDELGKAARDAAGWHACLDTLGYELAGEQPPWSPVERWEQVHAEYVEGLGSEASTIGPPESVPEKIGTEAPPGGRQHRRRAGQSD
jgi:uncharacterized protein YndB with AHSA1/START domain